MKIIPGDTVDWGRARPGTVHHPVHITNVGTDTLRIASVAPSCGCTTAPLDRNMLAPGDTATLDVSITLNAGEAMRGRPQKTIAITSNDPRAETRTLTMTGSIQLDLVPHGLSFESITTNVGIEHATSLDITNNSDTSIRIDPPTLVAPMKDLSVHFQLTKPRVLVPGERFRLTAYVTPKTPGRHVTAVTLKTSSSSTPELLFQLTCSAKEKSDSTNTTVESR